MLKIFSVLFLFLVSSVYAQFSFDGAVGYSYLIDDSLHAGGIKGGADYYFNPTYGIGLSADAYFYKIDDKSINENPLFLQMTFLARFKMNLLQKYFLYIGPGYEWLRFKAFDLTINETRLVAGMGGGMRFHSFGYNCYAGLDFITSMDANFNGKRLAALIGINF